MKEFFNFLIEQFEPEFAYITNWEDWKTKHYIRRPTFKSDGTYAGMGEGGMGFDFLEGIPGIYWMTYMTGEVIPPAVLSQLPSDIVTQDGRGYCIQSYPSSSLIGTEDGLKAEQKIRQTLGEDRFFDAESWLKTEMAKIK
ncbi:MAG: hypothetical protein B7Z26_02970 [Asticcacaulis sp. 32-58-5]|nr:MAG: hypothetical protein B7Z26_02970 [Asticcacaulis sp. 32-58-5]